MFGGGKSIRESMLQGTTSRAEGALDTVLTNVVVLDHWGSFAPTSASGTDGSSRSVTPGMPISPMASTLLPIGPATDVIAGEGRILTAGGIDMHVHFLSTSQVHEAWPPA